jgi:hypothetical protein
LAAISVAVRGLRHGSKFRWLDVCLDSWLGSRLQTSSQAARLLHIIEIRLRRNFLGGLVSKMRLDSSLRRQNARRWLEISATVRLRSRLDRYDFPRR